MHFGVVLALWMGARTIDVAIVAGLYLVRMFAITAGYHRYFAHRAFKTSRVFQFLLALIGTTATQKGPLWWAAIHRRHHRESDTPRDVHSPVQRGFWWSHMGWILANEHEEYEPSEVKDLWKYPELRWLDRWHVVPVLALLLGTLFIGGLRGLTWWYCVSTVLVMHGTFTINSLSHVWGHRRFATSDDSRNNPVLALITLGEGWHNNHHRYMHTANQGFYWWQVDISYYALKALSWVGVTWDLRKPPQRVLDEGRRGKPAPFVRVVAADELRAEPRSAAPEPKREPLLAPLPQPADAE
ncbi:MAG: acyl-CoA desaturase [Deltaproteobacteria bacterium]|nr:acyl-CoA desaturase [Deltaproteobacteria bacterium]